MKFIHLLLLSPLALACHDDGGTGSVEFSTWGEAYIEDGIPPATFVDGWSVKYRKFLVNIGHIHVGDGDHVVAQYAGTVLVDHTRPGVKTLASFTGLPARAYGRVSYEIVPVSSDTTVSTATEADRQWMLAGGLSIYVEAVATKGTVSKTYSWGFTTATRYVDCRGEVGGKEIAGVVVTNGGTDQPQITIHGDHFFYDDLQSTEAKTRFDNIAEADRDGDNVISLDELGRVKLAAIPTDQGPYGVGSADGVYDLRAFVTALSRTIGHYRGEGECFSKPL